MLVLANTPYSFKPTLIAGCVLYLAADRIAGLVDGAAVAQWDDLSGLGNHGTQGVAASRPLYRTGVLGGRPSVWLDGVDDFLSLGNAASLNMGVGDLTIYAVVVAQVAAVAAGAVVSRKLNGGAVPGWAMYVMGATGNNVDARVADGVNQVIAAGVVNVNNGVGHVLGYVCERAVSLRVYTDGAADGAPQGIGLVGNVDSLEYAAVGRNSQGNYFQGHVCEVVVYNRALNAGERRRLEAWLGRKYGIGVA